MKQNILVLGVTGMLGHTVFRHLFNCPDFHVYGTLRDQRGINFFPESMRSNVLADIDLLDQGTLAQVLAKTKPDVIINCVGLIKQFAAANNPLIALPINAMFPHQLAQAAQLINARVIHISTDCVFSGITGSYTEEDLCDAQDLYGLSKKIGELTEYPHAVTLRTSIIGHELNSKHSLIDWFLNQERTVKGYTKAIFSGLPTIELAQIIADYVIPDKSLSGLNHVSAEPIDKYTLLKLTAEVYAKEIEIIADDTLKIDRSLNAERFKKLTGYKPSPWPELITKMKHFR